MGFRQVENPSITFNIDNANIKLLTTSKWASQYFLILMSMPISTSKWASFPAGLVHVWEQWWFFLSASGPPLERKRRGRSSGMHFQSLLSNAPWGEIGKESRENPKMLCFMWPSLHVDGNINPEKHSSLTDQLFFQPKSKFLEEELTLKSTINAQLYFLKMMTWMKHP